jgi:hypothetical protein
MKLSVFPIVLVSFLLLFSCKKDHDNPATHKVNIDLSSVLPTSHEVIISEPGGNILLDTLLLSANNLSTTLTTNQNLLDYTLLIYDNITDRYFAQTYKGVDLTAWSSQDKSWYNIPYPSINPTAASVVYTHAPAVTEYYLLSNGYFPDVSPYPVSPDASGSIKASYANHNNNSLYFLDMGSGLYNFHKPVAAADTVDLSHVDTAVTVKFNMPATYQYNTCNLFGVMDTTDLETTISLYNFPIYSGQPDLVYPTKQVQKMELSAAFYSTNYHTSFYYYGYRNSFPAAIQIPAESSYTLNSTQANHFSVKFNSINPAYYYGNWTAGNIDWTVFCSSGTTSFNATELLPRSILLKNRDLSAASLNSFSFETAEGFNYQDLIALMHNPSLIRTKHVAQSGRYVKAF